MSSCRARAGRFRAKRCWSPRCRSCPAASASTQPSVRHADRLRKAGDAAVLNEIERPQATGTKLRAASAVRDVAAACQQLRAKAARAVIATLGSRGAVVVTADGVTAIPAFKAKVV